MHAKIQSPKVCLHDIDRFVVIVLLSFCWSNIFSVIIGKQALLCELQSILVHNNNTFHMLPKWSLKFIVM